MVEVRVWLRSVASVYLLVARVEETEVVDDMSGGNIARGRVKQAIKSALHWWAYWRMCEGMSLIEFDLPI